MGEIVASLEKICKSFSGVYALKNVNFDLRKGEVHALVGGNGAGKSTLMKILNGVYEKDSGAIRIDGQEVRYRNVTDAWKYGVRMIFQELSLSPTLSVMDNIFLTREIKRGPLLNKKAMRQKTLEALQSLSIDAKPDDIIADLPVGTCQLIEIAKALSTDARILILDEPTASLTDRETKTLFERIRMLKQQGISFIYISHRMKEILEISDRVSVLRDGELVNTADCSEYSLDALIADITAGKRGNMEYSGNGAAADAEELFRVENLSVSRKIKNVSFSVKKGEVVGIAGLMGSGRTETVETIFGIRSAKKETRMYMHGKPIKIASVQHAVKNGIAMIPEDRRRQGLILSHSLEQNVCLTNLSKIKAGILTNNRKGSKFADGCVEKFGIKVSNIHKEISHLSGGNQQKAVIAKWLETNPELLIMDEPTAGVDIGAKGEIIDIVRGYAAKGNGVLFISSEMQEMMAACDRILVYSNGRLTQELMRSSIDNEEVLEHAIQD